jgi:hypothetical protein
VKRASCDEMSRILERVRYHEKFSKRYLSTQECQLGSLRAFELCHDGSCRSVKTMLCRRFRETIGARQAARRLRKFQRSKNGSEDR